MEEKETKLQILTRNEREASKRLAAIDEELKPMHEEIKKVNNSIWMRIHGSILWFIFPWTSIIKKAKMKEIAKIEYNYRELLQKREEAREKQLWAIKLLLEEKSKLKGQ